MLAPKIMGTSDLPDVILGAAIETPGRTRPRFFLLLLFLLGPRRGRSLKSLALVLLTRLCSFVAGCAYTAVPSRLKC